MRQWLLKTLLFKWAHRQGGIDSFALAQKDILETMQDDLDTKAEELAKQKLSALLSPIDEKMVVKVTRGGTIFIGNEQVGESRLANLKSEAEFLLSSDIWRVIYETPKALAHKAMFEEGESVDFLKKGRAMTYTLATQQKILETLKNIQKKDAKDVNNSVLVQ